MPRDSLVVVLAAPGRVPAAVRDLLRDWVSLGLVQPLLWVDAAEIAHDDPALSEVVATHLLPDQAPRVRLQDHLANQRSLGAVRLVALGALGGPGSGLVPPALAGTLNTAVHAAAPGRVVALHCVLARQGAGGWTPEVVVPGLRTLVLAPEDAWNPDPTQPSTEFTVRSDDAEFTAHAASGLASVAGLWTGVSAGPFDEPGGDSEAPVVVRAFLRRLDTSGLTDRLRRSLTDLSRGLPLPQGSGGRVEALQDPLQGVAGLHAELVARHPELFEVRLIEAEQVRATPIGAWEAVRLFFAFLVSALRAAPSALVERVKAKGAGWVARTVQQALFGGADSRYEVIARGVNASGLPPGVRDLGRAADDVRERVAQVLPTEGTLPDLSGFWTDVVAGGLSLADAGDHGSSLGPVVVGGGARVVRDTALIAPAPADAFRVPPAVAQRLGASSVTPYDTRVQQHAAGLMAAVPGASDDGAYRRWEQRTAESYTGLVGRRLAHEVEQRNAQLHALLERLRADHEQVDEEEVGRGLRRVRTIVLRALAGVVLIAVLAVLARRFALLSATALALVTAGLLGTWLVSQVLVLLSQQRRIFALINAQRRADEALDVDSRNLPVVAAALHLSTVMYEQYLAWAPVLGRFLREPFGQVAPPAPAVRLHGVLPRAVGFGVAEADDERLEVVTHDLAAVVFDRGWLQPLWEAFLGDASRQVGAGGLALRDDPRLLFTDTTRGPDSLLHRWSARVAADGVAGGAGDALWARARTALLSRGTAELSDGLLSRVDVQAQEAHGIDRPLTGRDFFTALTDSLSDVERHHFSRELFSDYAYTQNAHAVASTVALGRPEVATLGSSRSSARVRWVEPEDGERNALDQFLVVVQASAGVPAHELALRDHATRGARPTDPPAYGEDADDDGTLV